ncbi:hypothetical protein GLOTRDRAFT_112687 [Gloeophyllum trabeum ATCC 11539]|uniref:Uncharacterized protein n=1 Tax=Gloeophyllum trabeum (strain ATCC 11539 / FP-39264 / Madison 617) TaxID=670483 RepID=S7PTP9_GLOTA|nr:uncharacterized protein GLOTRDRAFT_112687 [Gloeophyllum trabeum ATCC 11539]EPQ50707.1 hypothetical protein GLOTRDRAFT_112687 [Gloeophyllum trabeum ATCC 11539]
MQKAAMASITAPRHTIHTIHGSLAGKPLLWDAPLSGLPHHKPNHPPRSSTSAPPRISVSFPTSPFSPSESEAEALSWKVVRRPTKARRAPPPPPASVKAKADMDAALDPFADEMTEYVTLDAPIEIHIHPAPSIPPAPSPSPSPPSHSLPSPSFSAPSPSPLYQPPGLACPPPDPAKEHAARLKFVAGMLMYRVHCHVRPLRRWPGERQRGYVRSGLSRVVAVGE